MNCSHALLSLMIVLLTACTVAPDSPLIQAQGLPTRTSIAIMDGGNAETHSMPTQVTAVPGATPSPVRLPTPTPITTPIALLLEWPEPAPASESGSEPWQYFSGSVSTRGPVVYRLRYPAGWTALEGEGGAAVLQNVPPPEVPPSAVQRGIIRVAIDFSFAGQAGGFPAPNLKVLAAGRPGTRQILVDAVENVIIWNVRLYGLNDASTTMNFSAWLSGSPEEILYGIRMLDEMLSTLELYSWPDPTPAPLLPDNSIADDWQEYDGRIAAGGQSFRLRFRFPIGWWAYPSENGAVEITNFMRNDWDGRGGFWPGRMTLSISAVPCSAIGGCPERPPSLPYGFVGTREVSPGPDGETLWSVHIYKDQAEFTLAAVLGFTGEGASRSVEVMNMILRTLEITR